jgi:hypothetical protein
MTSFRSQKIKQVSEEVRALADQAQADVGYDYIWLADVTYHDWQRYHALVGSECVVLSRAHVTLTCVSHLRVKQLHAAGTLNSEWFSPFTSR